MLEGPSETLLFYGEGDQNENGRNAAAAASTGAGKKFATRIFRPHTRLTPTQKMRTDPIIEIFPNAASVIKGWSSRAKAVTLP